jgi:glucokinase
MTPVVNDAAAASSPSLPWLVGDIGGTNARFGWIEAVGGPVLHVQKLAVADHAGLAQAAAHYLADIAARLGPGYRAPRRAALAVATAVDGDLIAFTNSRWRFSRREVQAALGLERLWVLNDFEALALSLPRLKPQQLKAHGALPVAAGTLAVVGPGTGLGVGGVVQTRQGWLALPGEGGHATLAASDDFENQVLAHARRALPHVSGERLLSGIGLPTLHAAVAAALGAAPSPALDSAAIISRGCSSEDAVCAQTLETFCALLGGFAGNVALTLGARGGVYIGGGIVPRLGELFFRSRFRACFEAKGRFQPYLAAIPTALITDTLAALTGAALAIELDGA